MAEPKYTLEQVLSARDRAKAANNAEAVQRFDEILLEQYDHAVVDSPKVVARAPQGEALGQDERSKLAARLWEEQGANAIPEMQRLARGLDASGWKGAAANAAQSLSANYSDELMGALGAGEALIRGNRDPRTAYDVESTLARDQVEQRRAQLSTPGDLATRAFGAGVSAYGLGMGGGLASRGALMKQGAALGALDASGATTQLPMTERLGAVAFGGVAGGLTAGVLDVGFSALNRGGTALLRRSPEMIDKLRGYMQRAGIEFRPSVNEMGSAVSPKAGTETVKAWAQAMNDVGGNLAEKGQIVTAKTVRARMRRMKDPERMVYRQAYIDALEKRIQAGELSDLPSASLAKIRDGLRAAFSKASKGKTSDTPISARDAIQWFDYQISLVKNVGQAASSSVKNVQLGTQGLHRRLGATVSPNFGVPQPAALGNARIAPSVGNPQVAAGGLLGGGLAPPLIEQARGLLGSIGGQ